MDSEVAQLMPNMGNQQFASPGTTDLQNYMKASGNAVLAETQNRMSFGMNGFSKPQVREVEMRTGTGRVPHAKRFCIRVKRRQTDFVSPLQDHQVDPEELKEAILLQALQQRRTVLTKSLRPGTGRLPQMPKFSISIVARPAEPTPMSVAEHVGMLQQTAARTSRLATAKTPGSNGFSPMEGIPERVSRHGKRRTPLGPSMLSKTPGSNGFGFSPIEGIPEFCPVPRAPADPVVGSTMFAPSGSRQQVHDQAQQMPFDNAAMNGGDAGGMDYDDYDDMGGDYGGGDDGWDAMDDDGGALGMYNTKDPTPRPIRIRRVVQNPGVNLRKMHQRKSLVVDHRIGRHEVAPGVRRSTRSSQEPLKWWLGETKVFTRNQHRTMPTIETVTHKLPNTPWRTVADIPKGHKKYKPPASKKAASSRGSKKAPAAKQPRKRKAKDNTTSNQEEEEEHQHVEEEEAEISLKIQLNDDEDEHAASDAETESLGQHPAEEEDVLPAVTPGVEGPLSLEENFDEEAVQVEEQPVIEIDI